MKKPKASRGERARTLVAVGGATDHFDSFETTTERLAVERLRERAWDLGYDLILGEGWYWFHLLTADEGESVASGATDFVNDPDNFFNTIDAVLTASGEHIVKRGLTGKLPGKLTGELARKA